MTNELPAAPMPTGNHPRKVGFQSTLEFRWCYYLHLDTAKAATDDNRVEKQWPDLKNQLHPVFEIRGKKRLVLLRGYFDESSYGGKWCQIHKITTKESWPNGKKIPNLTRLGSVIPGDSRCSYIQTFPERYPLCLIEKASTISNPIRDPMTANMICKIIDHCSYKS